MTAADAKKQLRAQVRAQRRALPPEVLAADSRAITERLLELPEMERAERVFCYVSLPGEVETSPLIGRLLSQGRAVLVPRCRAGGRRRVRGAGRARRHPCWPRRAVPAA